MPEYLYLYIIRCHEFTKIGIASNVKNRLQTLQTGNPYPLELIDSFEFENALQVESLLHRKYENAWVQGEWFKLTDAEFAELIDTCRNFDESIMALQEVSVPAMLLQSALSYCAEAGIQFDIYNTDGKLILEVHNVNYADERLVYLGEQSEI